METPDKIFLNIPKGDGKPDLDATTWETREFADCINVEYIKNKPLDFDAEFAKFIDKIENQLCHKLPDAELFRLRACAKHFSLL